MQTFWGEKNSLQNFLIPFYDETFAMGKVQQKNSLQYFLIPFNDETFALGKIQ